MPKTTRIGILVALAVLAAGTGAYGYYFLAHELSRAEETLRAAAQDAEARETALREDLAVQTEEKITLAGELRLLEEAHNEEKRTVRKLSNTVNDLEKIVATDPELLAKYSKIYFLNENYAPAKLSTIAAEFAFQKERTYEIHAGVAPFLEDLLEDAKKEDLSLQVASGYRSYSSQAALKSGYRVRFGTGANAFSAEQGYSEHQLGTTIDFTTQAVGGTFVGFDKTDEYEWLTKHAHTYGFVLSYPKGNTYYQYESWHWRFVGKKLAGRLHGDEDYFYNLDQRVIDSYLGELFD
ncbi:MAG: D-alanyl-D-alanine carboxypeptidase family protein [Rectinemataceae bacterium]|nr:D-alanyl-D-alanine carboxypeptidase family protein [Rectinemataceae bacterium]